jgi:hypothetical protein
MTRRPRVVYACLAVALLLGCAGVPNGPSPVSSPAPALSPHPLPADLIPGREGPFAEIAPQSPPADPQLTYRFMLGHCGILSPIDFDGSLWDPVGASDASGGEIDERHTGELINATEGQLRLTAADTAQFRTASGLVLFLARHDGQKRYPICS